MVSQTNPTEIGRLLRIHTARPAASSICIGIGMKAANSPAAMARDTEWRLRCQRLGSCVNLPRKRSDFCERMLSGSGM